MFCVAGAGADARRSGWCSILLASVGGVPLSLRDPCHHMFVFRQELNSRNLPAGTHAVLRTVRVCVGTLTLNTEQGDNTAVVSVCVCVYVYNEMPSLGLSSLNVF